MKLKDLIESLTEISNQHGGELPVVMGIDYVVREYNGTGYADRRRIKTAHIDDVKAASVGDGPPVRVTLRGDNIPF